MMNLFWLEVNVIVVCGDWIVEVGLMVFLKLWFDVYLYCVDDIFFYKVIILGFIDLYFYLLMVVVLLLMYFIIVMEWKLFWDDVWLVMMFEGYFVCLCEFDEQIEDFEELFFIWGYYLFWYGEVWWLQFDELIQCFVVVWYCLFYEVIFNSGVLCWLGIDEESIVGKVQIDLLNGYFFENGFGFVILCFNLYILLFECYCEGFEWLCQVVYVGGYMMFGDMVVGFFDFDFEWQGSFDVLEQEDMFFCVVMILLVMGVVCYVCGYDEVQKFIEMLFECNMYWLQFGDCVKLFFDGVFFFLLVQLQELGYIDGYLGEWLMFFEFFEDVVWCYWNEGYKIYVYCIGDFGFELVFDIFEKLFWEWLWFWYGYIIEYFGFVMFEQVDCIVELGVFVLVNVYYLYEFSYIYVECGVGVECVYQMVWLGSCV